MSALLARLRAALGSDYDVMDEVASGGMGIVLRARDRTLDRLVAIKVMRPDIATAAAAQRFLREAQILASFSHPNIVPIHRAGEADGLPFYIMDFLEGETLASRLHRGHLPADEALRIADDLLGALAAVHKHGVVHRDVKPSNIFLADGRAILSDFGISKATSFEGTASTATGGVVGTPGYMPPEQAAGGAVTARTDVCAAGMVIIEMFTGRQWTFDSHADRASWSGIPGRIAPALRRALAADPGQRWEDAAQFRRALTRPRSRRGIVAGVTATALLLAAYGGFTVRNAQPTAAGASLSLELGPFRVAGDVQRGTADSLAEALTDALGVAQDITLRTPSWQNTLRRPAAVRVRGRIDGGSASQQVSLVVSYHGSERDRLNVAWNRLSTSYAEFAATIAPQLLLDIWKAAGERRELPADALPHSVAGLDAWSRAEAKYAAGQWGASDSAYQNAWSADTTCMLCALRLSLISRWMRRDQDTSLTRHLLANLRVFPIYYQRLIQADVDSVDRWSALDSIVHKWPDFDLAQFVLGDELYHRGPLAGRRRAEALPLLTNVVKLRPTFAPAWEHLAWVAAAEGDGTLARNALATYAKTAEANDYVSLELQAVLTVGIAWRFQLDSAPAITDYILHQPGITSFNDFASGPRYLLSFDAPQGVVWLGERFAAWDRAELHGPGLVGQIAGLMALGRADSALRIAGRLARASSDAEYALDAAEFDAAQTMFDSLDARPAFARVSAALAPLTRPGAANAEQRRRAAWMLTLLARRAGAPTGSYAAVLKDEPAPRTFTAFLAADSVGPANPQRAIDISAPLLRLDSAGLAGDPFFRAALHLSRAQWYARASNLRPAVRELRWHENSDLVGLQGSLMQAVDMDWAFGTLGRWNRGRLLQRLGQGGDDAEMCDAFAGVARLWAHGDARYAAHARDAGSSFAGAGCAHRP